MKGKKLILTAIFIICNLSVSIISSSQKVEAYVLNNQYVPISADYSITGSYGSDMVAGTNSWNYSGRKVALIQGSGLNIKEGVSNTDNGTYGVTYYLTQRMSTITYYSAWLNTTALKRLETVTHEVGHALGLSHTQSANNTISVMRATGFNGKAYPLSDDKSGMEAKY